MREPYYNRPDYKFYGQMRRMWVMLQNLQIQFNHEWDIDYNIILSAYLAKNGEAWCHRRFLREMLNVYSR